MPSPLSLGRAALAALTLLSACAASDSSSATTDQRTRRLLRDEAGAETGTASPYLIGRFAGRQGDYVTAAEQMLSALALDPQSVAIQRQAFLACLLAGRPQALQLARAQLTDPLAQLLLGNAAAKAGDWKAADSHYSNAATQQIAKVLQPLLTAWTMAGSGKPDAALTVLRPFVDGKQFRAIYALHAAEIADLADHAAEAGKFYRIAQTELGLNNLDLARALASWQARQGHPEDGRRTLAEFAHSSRDFAIALPRLNAALSVRPIRQATDGIAAGFVALAVAVRDQQSGTLSEVLLRMALDLRPDLTTARLLWADVAEQDKRPATALDMLAPIQATDPLAPVVDLRRAGLEERLGNTDAALKLADAVTQEAPGRPDPWTLKGALLRSKHRYAEAVTAYDMAVSLLPSPQTRTDWPLFYERGIALERSHDWPRAEADFMHALDLSPDEPFVLNYLAYSWTEQGHELDRARKMITRAAEQRPNDGAIVDSLGWIVLRQGDTGAAVKWLEKAVELESEDATINGHLGDAYWAAGRKLEASYQWQRALTLNPEPDDRAHFESRLQDARQALGIAAPAPHASAVPATANATGDKATP